MIDELGKETTIPECVCEKDGRMIALNLIYTFSMEFILFAYMIRLCRVLLINYLPEPVNRGKFQKFFAYLFSSQIKLFLLSSLWSGIIVGCDLWMKASFHEVKNGIFLYPQFDGFMCDAFIDSKYEIWANCIFIIKLTIYCSLFLFTFIKAGKLE